ncbi:hypothetical protein, partial [Staphylococcus aureus]|uniref:hypothetical protein n=1 Tax=Staphylococcus aureus TaxID=1280 RepID=UPI0028A20D7C
TLGNAYEKGTINTELNRESERTEHQTQSDRPKQVTRTNERSRGTDKDIEKRADVTRIEHYSIDNGDTQSVGQDTKP